jgi:hypothetical protein
MTRRAALSLLGLGVFIFALYAIFAVRTSERVSKHVDQFSKDYPKWRGK